MVEETISILEAKRYPQKPEIKDELRVAAEFIVAFYFLIA
jgi:hypothetical protein